MEATKNLKNFNFMGQKKLSKIRRQYLSLASLPIADVKKNSHNEEVFKRGPVFSR